MANHVVVTTFDSKERFEAKVVPPESDNNYSIMIQHGEKDLVSLRMPKGQLVPLYAAMGSALRKLDEPDASGEEGPGQRSLL